MPPLRKEAVSPVQTGVLEECDDIATKDIPKEVLKPGKREFKFVWRTVIVFFTTHYFAFYGIYVAFTSALWMTVLQGFFLYFATGFSITAGAHRLWSHRSYKAKWPLRLLLVTFQTIAHQYSVIHWARDHRVHHKFQETDADPHNAKRGFFFAHIGWLMCKKNPEVIIQGNKIDLSDLYADPLLRYQHKYFNILMPIMCFTLPVVIPMVMWNETFLNAFSINILRLLCVFHATALINSAAHLWGSKPYDKNINPTENIFVSIFLMGEGWHNYHHSFPWDYKASEFSRLNLTVPFINFFAKIGWAYDLRTVSPEMIKSKVLRSGDGSHEIWGWGDKDQTPENYKCAIIYNKKDD